MPNATTPSRDWSAIAGVTVVAGAAVILSFSALAGLGELVGWGTLAVFGAELPLSWLLPLCVDAYGATATRIAVNGRYSPETRRHALVHAVAAIVVSVLGNAMYHLIQAHVVDLGSALWVLVVAVSVVPPLALGALAHLMALCGRDNAAAPGDGVPVAVPVGVAAEVDEAAEREADEVIEALRSASSAAAAVPASASSAAGQVHPVECVPDVPEPREVYLRAVEAFAPAGVVEKLPPVREVKRTLNCGQERAKEVRAYLSDLAAG